MAWFIDIKRYRLKREKEEQFKRRAMGEKLQSKVDREKNRQRNQLARDEYDMENLGGYRLVYPVRNDPVKAKLFESFMDQSKILWAEVTGGARAKEQAIL